MRIIVCGGRGYDDLAAMIGALRVYQIPTTIVHGGATGADALADHVARLFNFQVEIWPADWRSDGKGAGPRRNQRMIDAGADGLVAFPGGRGTADCVRRAKRARIEVRRIAPPSAGFPRERAA